MTGEMSKASHRACRWRLMAAQKGLLSFVIALCAVTSLANAQDIRVSAEVDHRSVPLDGRLKLSLRIEGIQNVQAPKLDLEDFTAQYVGPSTQMSIINGVMSSSVVHTYILYPQKEGRFTIAPISLKIRGQTFQTDPIEVEVRAAGASGSASAGIGQTQGISLGDAIQLQIGLDRQQVYVNQAIPAKLQLLVGNVAVRGIEMPTLHADGFLVKPFDQPKQSEVVVGGVRYTLLEFHTEIVPITAGRMNLGPASIECQVVQRLRSRRRSLFGDDFFDGFFDDSLFGDFFGNSRLVPMTVKADAIPIEVLPLPEAGKPTDFTGAVGHFTLDVKVVPTELAAGEPATLTMRIRGNGNLETSAPPAIVGDLSRFKVYKPQLQAAAQPQVATSQKVFEQVLIPTDESVKEIPPIRFSFFDPELKQYRTLTKGPIALRVKPAPKEPSLKVVDHFPAAPSNQPEVLGRDIIYIKEELGKLRPVEWRWYRSPGTLLWLLAPFGFLLISEGIRRERCRLASDPAIMRSSGAIKRARSRYQQARALKARGDMSACYEGIFRTFQQYIGDRFNLPSEGLTRTELETSLKSRGCPEELLRDLNELFDRCDTTRFAQGSVTPEAMGETLRQTESILKRLERWRA